MVTALTSRDDGTLTLRVLAVVAWAGWAFLTAHHRPGRLGAAAQDARPHPARARPAPVRRPHPGRRRRPALRRRAHPGPHHTRRRGTPTRSDRAALARHHRRRRRRTLAHCTPARRAAQHGGDQPAPATTRHTVAAGESLWCIARDHLGDPTRYAQIAALNAHVLNGDPDLIHPGTILTLPAAAAPGTTTTAQGPAGTPCNAATPCPGSPTTPWATPDRYREILDASRDTTQPGGAHLVDPDVIDVGWTLTIPTPRTSGHAAGPTGDAGQATPPAPGAPAQPAPPPPPTTQRPRR